MASAHLLSALGDFPSLTTPEESDNPSQRINNKQEKKEEKTIFQQPRRAADEGGLGSSSSLLFPSLSPSSLDFSFDSLKLSYRHILVNFLGFSSKLPRTIFIESRLSPMCSALLGMKILSEFSQQIAIFPSAKALDAAGCSTLVCLVSEEFSSIASLIKTLQGLPALPAVVHCGVVPRLSSAAFRLLESHGLSGVVKTFDLPLLALPLDHQVASMERKNSFKESLMGGDRQIAAVIEVLQQIQELYGPIRAFHGKGSGANLLHRAWKKSLSARKSLHQMPEEAVAAGLEAGANKAEIHVYVIDREIDQITPMMSQLTYEGTIEELLGIEGGYVKLDRAILSSAGEEPANANNNNGPATLAYRLNDGDSLFARLRHSSFAFVLSNLRSVLSDLKSGLAEGEAVNAMTVKEMKDFVAQRMPEILKAKANANTHFNLCQALATLNPNSSAVLNCEAAILEQAPYEQFWPAIENLIQRHQPWAVPLRLLCLASLVNEGIKSAQFQAIRQEFLQAYGYEFLPLLRNLEKMGIFGQTGQTKRNANYSAIRRGLNILCSGTAAPQPASLSSSPQDLSFAYSFSQYAPLSCRLLENFAKSGGSWREVDKLMKEPISFSSPATSAPSAGRSVALVVFLGGCCSTELSCLRWLNWKKVFPPPSLHPGSSHPQLVFLTTQFLTGHSLLEQLR